jgi:multiple sugar transport system permease protein
MHSKNVRAQLVAAKGRKKAGAATILADAAAYAFIAVTLFLAVTPILWTFLSSFKIPTDIATIPPKLLFTPTLENYRIVIEQGSLLPGLRSSVIVTLGATILSLLIGAPAAYYLARSAGTVAVGLGGIVMSTRFIPVIVLLIPLLIAFRSLRLTGSLYGLMIAYQLATLPFVILVLWAAFTQIPRELDEAVLIDGGTPFTAFLRVNLPLAAPSLGAATILAALFSWNQFIIPVIIGSGGGAPLAIMGFARYSGGEEALADWGALSAWASILMLPMIAGAFVVQRHLIAAFGGEASVDSS